jgi:hypothetical protein
MNALNPQTNAGSVRFWSSAATPATTAVMARLWGAPLTVQHL